MIEYPDPQNTPGWHEARRGVKTASRASDMRRTDGLTKQQRIYVNAILAGIPLEGALAMAGYKKKPAAENVAQVLSGELPLTFSEAGHTYAKQLARERIGGYEPEGRQGLAQREGHEQEPFARIAYMDKTGRDVVEVGFICTDDRLCGMSVDGMVYAERGAIEVKTMVSTATLFQALVDGDISEYRDQCLFGLWIFNLEWVDLCLWVPDLQVLHVIRIERDEEEIQRLEDDLIAFEALVCEYTAALRRKLGMDPAAAPAAAAPAVEPPPWNEPAAPAAPARVALAVPEF